jgi:V/A-type H+-transporting ATPase subunit F
MKAFILSDSKDSLNGFRLIGIDGYHVLNKEELSKALDTLMKSDEVSLIMITTKMYNLDRDFINDVKLSKNNKIILEVPDRHSSADYPTKLDSYLSDIIG